MELIKIEENEGKQTVNARELHSFLAIKTKFADWLTRRFKEYDFKEGADFITILNYETSPPSKEYYLALDTAKEISMVERNEKGKQARRYFIECERKAKENIPTISGAELMLRQAQIIVNHEKQLEAVNSRLDLIESKAITSQHNFFTVSGYCNLNGVQVTQKQAADLGRQCAKLSREKDIQIDTIPDPRFGKVNAYHVDVLQEIVC